MAYLSVILVDPYLLVLRDCHHVPLFPDDIGLLGCCGSVEQLQHTQMKHPQLRICSSHRVQHVSTTHVVGVKWQAGVHVYVCMKPPWEGAAFTSFHKLSQAFTLSTDMDCPAQLIPLKSVQCISASGVSAYFNGPLCDVMLQVWLGRQVTLLLTVTSTRPSSSTAMCRAADGSRSRRFSVHNLSQEW